jgi:hypothetical protein
MNGTVGITRRYEAISPMLSSIDRDHSQWVASTQNGLWYFKSVASGRYLAIDGEASDNGAVVGSTNPFGWNIWPDEDNVNVLRYVVAF